MTQNLRHTTKSRCNRDYFVHTSQGQVVFDPARGTRWFAPHWAMVECDPGIVDYYSWLLLRNGVDIYKGSVYGPHISLIKGEEPPNAAAWGQDAGPVEFRYANIVRYDNGRHAWLDVWSPQLAQIRQKLGLPGVKETYHLTLGRLKLPF